MWKPRWLAELRHSNHQRRVHAYSRYSLYFVMAMELMSIAVLLISVGPIDGGWATLVLCLLVTHHTLVMLMATRDSLSHYLRRGPRPTRLLPWAMGMTCATTLLVGGGIAVGQFPREFMPVALFVTGYYAGPVALQVPWRRVVSLTVPAVVSYGVAILLYQRDPTTLVAQTIALFVLMGFLGGTFRASAWTLRVLDRVDAARETEKRLAVAEERLRFGRDLHDVLGRNLSVIALKSELAAQLARRGSAQAVDQLAEVQRIARESQREIREVVRGYREVDLRAELAGARGVLEAADIRCSLAGVNAVAPTLPAEVGSTLGWVVREGVTNVLRHASASRCAIGLARSPDGLAELSLENDGVNEDGARVGTAGSGLAGLRERLSTLGGTLSVESLPGGVFRLTARVPTERRGPAAPGGGPGQGMAAVADDGGRKGATPSRETSADARAGVADGSGKAGGRGKAGAVEREAWR